MIQSLFHVALGGAVGSALRYLSILWMGRIFGRAFPYGTLFVNVLGGFAMGVFVVVLVERADARWQPLLMTGLLGGFTTFSAFSLDAVTLWERGQPVLALAYVAGSVLLSLAALVAGLTVARSLL